MTLRLTRLEVSLLVAWLLLLGTQMVLSSLKPAAPSEVRTSSISWKEQERFTREQVRKTMGMGRQELADRVRQHPSVWWRFQIAVLGCLFLFFGSIFQWLRIFFGVVQHRPLVQQLGNPPPPTWSLREILRLILCILVAVQLCVLAEWRVIHSMHPPWLDRHVLALVNTLLVDAVAVAGAAWFFLRGWGRETGDSGWNGSRIQAGVRFGIRSYLTAIPIFLLLLLVVAAVLNLLKIQPPPQAVFTIYLSEKRGWVLKGLLLLAVVAGPIAEELFFRGLLYGWLRVRIGVWRALWGTAFLFAFLHTDPVAFLPILGLGLLFGWVYEKTGSLAASMAVHIFHNAGMLYVASLVKAISSLT